LSRKNGNKANYLIALVFDKRAYPLLPPCLISFILNINAATPMQPITIPPASWRFSISSA
jgi:hypothetical protein